MNRLIEEILKSRLIPSADFIYGFADLKGLLADEFFEFPYGISIGKRLDDHIIDKIENGPTVEYFNHYKNRNAELDELARNICDDLRKEHINCLEIVPSLNISGEEFKPYFKKLRYKVSHKMVATRAGLGWIGKTDLLITPNFGPRLRLVSILIDTPVKTTRRVINKSKCGSCNLCVQRCPIHAANGISWDTSTDRDLFFDAQKCRYQCMEFGKSSVNMETPVCGICVSVCPFGKIRSKHS